MSLSFAITFLLVVALATFLQRRSLAQVHSAILGGRVMPGCVVAEAVALVVLALVIFSFRDQF